MSEIVGIQKWDIPYLKIAFEISKLSPDIFTKVGCVAANEYNEAIGMSYNGFARKYSHSQELLEDRERKNLLIFHAEQNLILRHPRGSIERVYLTHNSCSACSRLLAGHGVKEVVYCTDYFKDQGFKEIFKEYGVKWRQIELHHIFPPQPAFAALASFDSNREIICTI